MKSILSLIALLSCLVGSISAQNQITFQVDMSGAIERGLFEPSGGDSLVVRGSFNDWRGNGHPLALQVRPAIYAETYELPGPPAGIVQFKFVIVSQRLGEIWEWRPNPDNTDHGNRSLILTGAPATIPGSTFDFDTQAGGDSPSFSVEELREDFQQLRSVIEDSHPALYVFTSEAAFDSLYEARSRLINRPMTVDEFYTIVAPVVARIGCGHSRLWMPEGHWSGAPAKFFPLKLKFLNGKAYAVKYFGTKELLEPGSEIVAINGVPVTEIVETLMEGTTGDGFNRGYRLDRLERRFHLIYARFYGYPDEFRLTYFPHGDGDLQEQVVPSVGLAVIAGRIQGEPLLTIEVLEPESAAVVTINSFSYYDDLETFRQFTDTAFETIDELKIRNLILDLRDNDGGDPFAASYLLSYLAPRQITYFAKPYGQYISLAFPLPQREKRFAGKVYTLTNGRCFSTTGHLCALMKYHEIGTFVGSETGGTYTCNDAVKVTTLENTQLQAQIARASFRVEVYGIRRDRGIVPDHEVEPRIEDVIEGTDTVKEYVLKLLTSS
ncbi:MAG: S41 family peptidase [Bacteroidota bacterium]